MKRHLFPTGYVLTLIGSLFLVAGVGLAAETKAKPVLLYTLHYQAEGENRYPPEGSYKEVLARLRQEFDVRINALALTADTLADVKVVLMANPNDKAVPGHPPPAHISATDVQVLTEFVRNGGGLIVMENQENHNLEVEDSNKLLAQFGIQATNLYTDAKQLVLPRNAPIIGGLRWAYYTGNSLLLNHAHPARPRIVVMNDLKQKPLRGPRDQPGVLLASARLARGRVLVVTDSGWITNAALSGEGLGGVAIKDQDNWEIMRRLTRWAARLR